MAAIIQGMSRPFDPREMRARRYMCRSCGRELPFRLVRGICFVCDTCVCKQCVRGVGGSLEEIAREHMRRAHGIVY